MKYFLTKLSLVIIMLLGIMTITFFAKSFEQVRGQSMNVQMPTLPTTSEFYPDGKGIVNQWKLVSITTPQPSTEHVDYSSYIKKPNKPLSAANAQPVEPVEAPKLNVPSVDQEYNDKMEKICENFLAQRRAQNYTPYAAQTVYHREVYDREVMSFKNFAESCTNYYKNNRVMQTQSLTTPVE